MDGLIAQAYTPYDVPHLSSGGNGNLSPNPYHTRLEPDDYQSGAFSTVIGDYETPDADHEDFSEFINFDSEEQAVVSRVTFVLQGLCGFVAFSRNAWNKSLLLLNAFFQEFSSHVLTGGECHAG